MGTLFIIAVVLVFGIWCGFMLGFSRAMHEVATKMQGRKPSFVPWGFVIAGGAFLLVAFGSGIHSWLFVRDAVRTSGSVVEMRASVDHEDGGTTYAPTFRFRDAAGVEHTASSSFYRSPPAHQVGDNVVVLYRPSVPGEARIDSFAYLWGVATFTGGFAIVLLVIGLAWLHRRRRILQ